MFTDINFDNVEDRGYKWEQEVEGRLIHSCYSEESKEITLEFVH